MKGSKMLFKEPAHFIKLLKVFLEFTRNVINQLVTTKSDVTRLKIFIDDLSKKNSIKIPIKFSTLESNDISAFQQATKKMK